MNPRQYLYAKLPTMHCKRGTWQSHTGQEVACPSHPLITFRWASHDGMLEPLAQDLKERGEHAEQRVQMLLGIFAAHGVLPLEFKPAYSVADLLVQHLDSL